MVAATWFIATLMAATGRAQSQTPPKTPPTVGVVPSVEVVVEGTRPLLLSSPRSLTGASTVLVGDQVHRTGDSSADVLRQVPGVQVTRTGASSDSATLSIRGASAYQVPVYLAGIRLNDEVTGSADLSLVPLWMMQRIEVFRGNAPVASDRLGLAGAVYFEPRHGGSNDVGAGVEAGSHGQRAGWVGAQVGGPNASALVAVRSTHADNDYEYLDDHGQRFDRDETTVRRRNADFSTQDAWAIGDVRRGRLRFVGLTHAMDKEQGVTGIATTPATVARAQRRRLLTGLSAFAPCSADDSCELQLNTSLLVESTALRDPLRELRTLRSVYAQVRGERFNQSARWVWEPTADTQLGISGHYTTDSLSLTRLSSLPRDARRTTLGATLDANVRPTEPLLVHAMLGAQCANTDGQYERLSQPTEARQQYCDADDPDARVGLSYDVASDWMLLANAGKTARLPTLGELYGTGPLVDGNPELKPERSVSVDMGVRGTARSARVTASVDSFVFGRWSDELVRYRRTSLNAISPYNVGSARVLGAELAAATRWYAHVSTRTAMTLLDPRETTSDALADPTVNDVLPLTSRLVLSQSVDAETTGESWNVRRALLGVRYFYRSNRFADPAGLVVLPEQHQVDLLARVHLRRPNLECTVSVDDVFDAATLDILGLPVAGRTFHASVEAWW